MPVRTSSCRMIALAASVVLGTVICTGTASAADCGEPPVDAPTVPSGASASPNDMRIARERVIAYSDEVDQWLTCMDNRSSRLAQFLTREQRARLTEDLNKLHTDRQAVQRKLNTEIRAYRDANRSG